MCEYSKALAHQKDVEVGQQLVVGNLPTQHEGQVLGFGIQGDRKGCGVCLKTDWGMVLAMSSTTAEKLHLMPGNQPTVRYFARFIEAGDAEDRGYRKADGFVVEIGEGEIFVPFGESFRGVEAEVVAAPGQSYVFVQEGADREDPGITPEAVAPVTVSAYPGGPGVRHAILSVLLVFVLSLG